MNPWLMSTSAAIVGCTQSGAVTEGPAPRTSGGNVQTLDRHDQLESTVPSARPKRRTPIVIGLTGAVVLAVLTGLIAYSLGSSGTKTKTVVEVVPPKVPTGSATGAAGAAPAAAPACIPGAAAGSCNTDEAAEALIPDKPLPPATRAIEAAELVTAREAAARYPTVADATRAGFVLAGAFSPLTGAHYVDFAHAVGPFDPAHPGSYIYDGTHPTSKIIGLMYLGSDVNPPAGFAGPNDHWHRHANTCVIFGSGGSIKVPFPADSSVTKTQCDNVKGTFMRRTTWMVHAWVVPGWESPAGVFAHDNKDVVCADGSVKANSAGFCTGT